MEEDPVLIPLEGDAQLEVDGVVKLGDGEHVHQAGGHVHLDGDHRVVLRVGGEWRNLLVVTILKHNQAAKLLIRFILAVYNLVASVLHSSHTELMYHTIHAILQSYKMFIITELNDT